MATFFRFFQLFSNFPLPYRSETIRNGFPVKFRIDIGPDDLKKHFSRRKIIKKSSKITKIDSRSPRVPATYYGSSYWIFLEIFETSRATKHFFFEHETKTKIFDRSILCIGPRRYAAQFLDRLEHSECTNLFGDFFFRDFFLNPPIFTMVIPIVNCRRCRRPGVDFDDFSRFFIYFRREKCFSNLSGPISTRNFTGNPFLMVSERYDNAKLEKS